jgi:hypothetical protein
MQDKTEAKRGVPSRAPVPAGPQAVQQQYVRRPLLRGALRHLAAAVRPLVAAGGEREAGDRVQSGALGNHLRTRGATRPPSIKLP